MIVSCFLLTLLVALCCGSVQQHQQQPPTTTTAVAAPFHDLIDSQIRVNHAGGYCFLSSASFSRDGDDSYDIGVFLKPDVSDKISDKELDEEINAKLQKFYNACMDKTECFWCYYYGFSFHTDSLQRILDSKEVRAAAFPAPRLANYANITDASWGAFLLDVLGMLLAFVPFSPNLHPERPFLIN